jgi:hypothetical protein
VKIDVVVEIEAPPRVVYRFYTMLDHLRFICPPERHEWCTRPGVVLEAGIESEARIRQGRHAASVRFRTVRVDPDRGFEDEFVSWPLRGARHIVRLEAMSPTRTRLENVITWDPPWYLRRLVDRHEAEQRAFFADRQENAKRIIEAVYRVRGEDAFASGIVGDAAAAGIQPIVTGH